VSKKLRYFPGIGVLRNSRLHLASTMNGCGILTYALIAKVVAGFSGVVVFLFLSGAADFFLCVGGFL
jgi:hypothetical protein